MCKLVFQEASLQLAQTDSRNKELEGSSGFVFIRPMILMQYNKQQAVQYVLSA
jgi:hypothetical protein